MEATELIEALIDTAAEIKENRQVRVDAWNLLMDIRSHLKHDAPFPKEGDETDVEYIYRMLWACMPEC